MSQLFLPGVYERIQRWLAQAEAALRDVAAGRPARPPARLVIPQAELQPWARGTVWDCREAGDCRPLLPSTRSDEVGCAASIDRRRVREAARELGRTAVQNRELPEVEPKLRVIPRDFVQVWVHRRLANHKIDQALETG